MRLVVNGDDLGYTKANTLGIIEAYEHGILRSTTALANSRYLGWAAERTHGLDDLGVGVHLTLTLGPALTGGRSLAREDGTFRSRAEVYAAAQDGTLDWDEVEREWQTQVARFCEVFGRTPTHLDSHHGVHRMAPEANEVAARIAGEYGVAMRASGPFEFVTGFWDQTATAETLVSIMEGHAGQDIELMCHPGYCDLELYRTSSYALGRVRELDALCDERVLTYVRDHDVELCHY